MLSRFAYDIVLSSDSAKQLETLIQAEKERRRNLRFSPLWTK